MLHVDLICINLVLLLKEEDSKYPISPISGKEVSIFDEEGIDKNPQYKFIGIAFKTYARVSPYG